MCSSKTDCLQYSDHTTCHEGLCACEVGYKHGKDTRANEDNKEGSDNLPVSRECRRFRLFDECSRSLSCSVSIPGSYCNAHNTCVCLEGFAWKKQRQSCERRRIGDVGCLVGSDCSAAVKFSECVEGACVCKIGFKVEENGTVCERVPLGDHCLSSQYCLNSISNSVCLAGLCVCQLGYGPPISSSSYKELLASPSFLSDLPISSLSNNHLLSSFHRSDHSYECGSLKLKEGRCRNDTDCHVFNHHSECLNHTCECRKGYYIEDGDQLERRQCSLRRLNVGVCHNDQECMESVSSTVCGQDSVCVCAMGFVEYTNDTSDEAFCKARSLEDNTACSSSDDCEAGITGAACINETCQCKHSHVAVNNTHCRHRQVYDSCSSNHTCFSTTLNSFCSLQLQCECEAAYVPDADMHWCTLRRIGSLGCEVDSECSAAVNQSVCLDGECVCEVGYVATENGTECGNTFIGATCDVDEDCLQSINNTLCNSSICQCRSGYKAVESLLECSKIRIGEQGCADQQACHDAVEDSFCETQTSTCLCVSGYAVNEERNACVRRKIGDQNCEVSQDCSHSIRHGNCSQTGQCVCETGHYPAFNDSYTCLRRRLYDESRCEDNVDCSSVINSSHCEDTKCTCITGYIGTSDLQDCRSRILGDVCTNHIDCDTVVEYSRCFEGVCACLSGYAGVGVDGCRKRKVGDANCFINTDCSDAVEHSECIKMPVSRNKKQEELSCQCVKGYYEDLNGTVCVKSKFFHRWL